MGTAIRSSCLFALMQRLHRGTAANDGSVLRDGSHHVMPGPPLPVRTTVDQMTAAVMLWIRPLTVSRRAFRSLGDIVLPPQVAQVYSFMPSGEIPDRCFASRILNEVIFYALTGRKPARSAGLFNAFPNQLLADASGNLVCVHCRIASGETAKASASRLSACFRVTPWPNQ